MRLRSCLGAMALVFSALTVGGLGETPGQSFPFSTLQPGQFREIHQKLKVNVVFIGFEKGNGYQQINEATFRTYLPQTYRTLNLRPLEPDGTAQWIGNSFEYDYNIVYPNRSFENKFFRFLNENRLTDCVVTVFQDFYNNEPQNTVDITDNSCIDATKTEKWLADNAAQAGVDSSQYTVFFINWWGRPDFHFHAYLNYQTPDPDPDTGFNFANFQYYETQAWGGTTPDDEQNGLGRLRRVWFYDVSAGPDANTVNYSLSIADLDGDGGLDYRIPPIWEYGNMAAYRPFDDLSGDLSAVLRYVALDSLFTKSPIFDPALSRRLPDSIQTNINYYDADPPATGASFTSPDRALLEWKKLRPFNQLTTNERNLSFSGEAASIYECALPFLDDYSQVTNCYPGRSQPFIWDLNLYHTDHVSEYVTGNADYEIQNFNYTVPANLSPQFVLGIAFTNQTGAPGFTYDWLSPNYRSYAGATSTVIHEVGHHYGLDHPHALFDFEQFFYLPNFWFDRLGDESDSVMGYLFLSNNVSQFDRDNMDRWMTAININHSNKLLPGILASGQVGSYTSQLARADAEAGLALTAYKGMDYRKAAELAKSSYDRVRGIADQLGVEARAFENADAATAPASPRVKPEGPLETKWFNPISVLEDPFIHLPASSNSRNRSLNNAVGEKKGFLKARK